MADYDKLAWELLMAGRTWPDIERAVVQALERAGLEARIEQAYEDGQLALRVNDEELPNDDIHNPDEVTRRIQWEVIPALRKRLEELGK